MDFNPILSEIQGLSPAAKSALGMAGHVVPPVDPGLSTPPVTPGRLLPSGDAPPSPRLSMADPVPSLGPAPSPNVAVPRGTIAGDTNARGTLLGEKPGVENIASNVEGSRLGQAHPFLGKLLGGVAQGAGLLGDTLLHAASPGLEREVPGTEGAHKLGLANANTALTQDVANEKNEAEAGNNRATAAHTEAETPTVAPLATSREGLENAQTEEAKANAAAGKSVLEVHDTEDGPIIFNKSTGAAQHVTVDGQPVGPKLKLTQSQPIIGPDGKPHTYLLDDKGNKKVDLGEHYERPINVTAGENHQFAERERGRGLLDKAEGAYRTAQQGANTMRDMVASASAGNKMSAQVLPLEGALAITTAQGVHRINRTEVDQYAGAGDLYDRIVGKVGKLAEGQPIPKDILGDIQKLTDIQERGAYQTYKGAYDSATRRYGLKDEQALPEPAGGGNSQHKEGDKVMLGGKEVTIKKINKDGTFDY